MILWGKKKFTKGNPFAPPPPSPFLYCPALYWNTTLTIWPNIKARRQISQFSKFLVNWGWKFGNVIYAFYKSQSPISFMNWEKLGNIHSSRPTFQNPIPMLNLWMSKENLCPNLSLTVENKMGNSHKKGWSHFKHNINDWGIPFLKMLRVCQWIWKNIFHWGKWNEPIKLIKECVRLKIKI